MRYLSESVRPLCADMFLGQSKKENANRDDAEPCYNTASGCLCLVVRAAPLVFGMIASQLRLAIIFFLGALALRYGQGFGRGCDQAYKSGCKFNHLRDQVHGHLTSFRKRRRCQRTGLTPLAFSHYSCNTGTYVLKVGIDPEFSRLPYRVHMFVSSYLQKKIARKTSALRSRCVA